MRLNPIYFKKHARAYQNENKVPFKEVTPLSLRNEVSSNSQKTLEDKCLLEMSLLFRCWKEQEFNEKACKQYVEALNECYKRYLINSRKQKELQKIDIPTPNAKTFTSKQLTYLLRKYPTV